MSKKQRWMTIEDTRTTMGGIPPFEVYLDKGWLFRNWFYMEKFATLKEAEEFIDNHKDVEFYGRFPVRLRK